MATLPRRPRCRAGHVPLGWPTAPALARCLDPATFPRQTHPRPSQARVSRERLSPPVSSLFFRWRDGVCQLNCLFCAQEAEQGMCNSDSVLKRQQAQLPWQAQILSLISQLLVSVNSCYRKGRPNISTEALPHQHFRMECRSDCAQARGYAGQLGPSLAIWPSHPCKCWLVLAC